MNSVKSESGVNDYNKTTSKLKTFRLPVAVSSIKRDSDNRIHMLCYFISCLIIVQVLIIVYVKLFFLFVR